jgi:hypothetical protein
VLNVPGTADDQSENVAVMMILLPGNCPFPYDNSVAKALLRRYSSRNIAKM